MRSTGAGHLPAALFLVAAAYLTISICCGAATPTNRMYKERDRWDYNAESEFEAKKFIEKTDKAMSVVRQLIDLNRQPLIAGDAPGHEYSDNFILAEFIATTAIAAQLQVLEHLGVSNQKITELLAVSTASNRTRPIIMKCRYVETTVLNRTIDSLETIDRRRTRSVTEYVWRTTFKYKLRIVVGDPTINKTDQYQITLFSSAVCDP